MYIKKLSLLTLIALILTSCNGAEEDLSNVKIPRGNTTIKEVQVFEIGKEDPVLFLETTGQTNSAFIAAITPEINGRVVDINVRIGEVVKKGQTLITLDDTLNIDLNEIQLETAVQSHQLLNYNQQITNYSGSQTIDAAQIGVIGAYQAIQTAQTTKENTIKTFKDQYQSTEIEIENARLALNNARDTLEDLEDLEKEGTELDMEIRNAKLAVETAENRYEQSQIGLEQVVNNYKAQFTQINSQIKQSETAYANAINQLESAMAAAELQNIGAMSQIVQNQSAIKSAQANAERKFVKSPIAGIVTEIRAEIGSLASPGQTLIRVENDQRLVVEASVNPDEANFIEPGKLVLITYKQREFQGEIVSISPTLNPDSRKVELEIIIDEREEILPAGAFVKVFIPVRTEAVVFIPLNSIFVSNGEKFVRVVNQENEVEFKEVKAGMIIGDFIEVTEGLEASDKLITTIDSFLNEGERVKVITNE